MWIKLKQQYFLDRIRMKLSLLYFADPNSRGGFSLNISSLFQAKSWIRCKFKISFTIANHISRVMIIKLCIFFSCKISNQSHLPVSFCAFHWHQHSWRSVWTQIQIRTHWEHRILNKHLHSILIHEMVLPLIKAQPHFNRNNR